MGWWSIISFIFGKLIRYSFLHHFRSFDFIFECNLIDYLSILKYREGVQEIYDVEQESRRRKKVVSGDSLEKSGIRK